jgi:hypothetical protein
VPTTASISPLATSGPSTPTSQQTSSAASTSALPAGDSETAAVQALNRLRADSLSRVRLDGRWVAQVASKSVGITDPLQTTRNGSHTFAASDILAESTAAQSAAPSPSDVYVLWSTDFGKHSTAPDGSPYWVTVVDDGFSSATDVQAWCARTYSSLSPAVLADTCAPRTLDPSHG